VRKWWKKSVLKQIRKRETISVVQVANRKLEDITSKELYAFVGIRSATGRNRGKKSTFRRHVDKQETLPTTIFWNSDVKEQVQISLSIHKIR
jgi:hypothetical protein